MAESRLHHAMKDIVRRELEDELYLVIEEPVFPPGERLSWTSYRPDLLAYRASGTEEETVLVECETRPNARRFASKNHGSVWFQRSLFRRGSVRKILAVPRGRLGRVDMKLRKERDFWVIGRERPELRVPAMR